MGWHPHNNFSWYYKICVMLAVFFVSHLKWSPFSKAHWVLDSLWHPTYSICGITLRFASIPNSRDLYFRISNLQWMIQKRIINDLNWISHPFLLVGFTTHCSINIEPKSDQVGKESTSPTFLTFVSFPFMQASQLCSKPFIVIFSNYFP